MGRIDVREVDLGLAALRDRRLVADIVRDLKKPLRADQRDHAKAQEGPEGKWPARRLGGRRRILGRLPSAVKVTGRNGVVTVASRASWSLAHQEGGRVGRGAVLPARPFLWISEAMLAAAAQISTAHVLARFQGGP